MFNNKKVDYKKILESIVSKYGSKEATFEFFVMHASELGVLEVDFRRKAVKLRDERTASTHFLPYLKYTDFGDEGRVKDVIDRLQEIYECNFVEAVKKLMELENEPINYDEIINQAPYQKLEYKKEIRAPYSQYYIEQRKKEAKENASLSFKLLKELCRSCNSEEYKRAVKFFNIGLIKINGYNGIEDRLFIPEYDENNIPWGSFSYNRNLNPKGKLRKDSRRVLFGSHLMKYFNKNAPIIFTEGHSDCIVNNAKLFQSITTGSATTPIRDYMFPLLEGRVLHFFPDADEAGMKGIMQKIIDIELYNSDKDIEKQIKYKIYWWSDKVIAKDNRLLNRKFWIDFQNQIFEKKGINPTNPDIFFEKWTIIKQKSKEYIQEGYDFIDFHNEYQNTPGYKKFMSRYHFNYPF